MKNRKRMTTVLINLLFIAAIAAVGWKIYDYVNDSRQTTELAEALWEEAAITAAPVQEAEAAVPDLPADETEKTGGEPREKEGVKPEASPEGTPAPERKGLTSGTPVPEEKEQTSGTPTPEREEQASGIPTPEREGQASGTPAPEEKEQTSGTPAPERKERASGEKDSVFLNLVNTTATPAPTPRFTDMPDIPIGIDFEKLAKTNRDVRAWLYHPGMKINLPVVQARDNEYYLRRGFNRFTRRAGTLFIDYRNKGDFSDRNTIIYGHGRTDLTMFGKLHYYKQAEYCEQHPFFYLYVPGHRYRMEIVTTGYTKDASMYYDLPAGDYWDELVEKLMERSPYDFGIPLSPDDHYVTLSTCAYDYQDERWLVIARIDDPDGTLPDFQSDLAEK